MAFSPTSPVIALTSVTAIWLWNTEEKEEKPVSEGHWGLARAMALSPDGKWVASVFGRAIGLFNTEREKEICMLKGHSEFIHSVAFSPNSQLLASASVDKTVRLWYALSMTPKVFNFEVLLL